jgi:hypothetical protein
MYASQFLQTLARDLPRIWLKKQTITWFTSRSYNPELITKQIMVWLLGESKYDQNNVNLQEIVKKKKNGVIWCIYMFQYMSYNIG